MSTQIHGKGLLLKADPIAAVFREEVASSLKNAPRKPKLVGILATSSAPSRMYAEFTKKQCEQFGVEFVLRKTGAAESTGLQEGEGVEEAIMEANEDDQVDGIMVCTCFVPKVRCEYPCPRYTTRSSVPSRSVANLERYQLTSTRLFGRIITFSRYAIHLYAEKGDLNCFV